MQTVNRERDYACAFLKKLTNDLYFNMEEMKQDFIKNPPQANIKERFLLWKQKHQDSINACFQLFVMKGDNDTQVVSFKEYLDKSSEEYQNDPEYMELLKNANNQIEDLKEFIRQNLAKDPSIYIMKDI